MGAVKLDKEIQLDEAIKLEEVVHGHIILYCKGWYTGKNRVEFMDGLRRIWEIRCGLPKCGSEIDKYIANAMYKILIKCEPKRESYLHELLHDSLDWNLSVSKDATPIQRAIWFYRERLCNLKIRDGKKLLVALPKPQKQLFKRIVAGNGRYSDYEKIKF